MKRLSLFALTVLLFPSLGYSADLRGFLKACAWGTAIGAGVGVVSLAFEDKPSENWNNVAKGASLGLYGGIAYGVLSRSAQNKPVDQYPDFSLAPQFNKGQIEGLRVSGILYSF